MVPKWEKKGEKSLIEEFNKDLLNIRMQRCSLNETMLQLHRSGFMSDIVLQEEFDDPDCNSVSKFIYIYKSYLFYFV